MKGVTGRPSQRREPGDDLEAVVARATDISRRILILDFDGTLSRIVDQPDEASLVEGAKAAIEQLAGTPVAVAVLSGRHVDDLEQRVGDLPVLLVGGHGAEAREPDGTRSGLVEGEELAAVVETVRGELEQLVGEREGWLIEEKPHSIAVHYRRADDSDVGDVLERVRQTLRDHVDDPPGWDVLDGKEIVELRPTVVNKGQAVRWIAARHPGRKPLVVGDDVTDEEAFAAANQLGGEGVVVEPQPRRTAARWRLADPDRVVVLLERLAEAAAPQPRPATPSGEVEHAIELYGLISDSRTAALVSPDGSVDWLCLPRFDSPSVFAALLDPRRGGRWRIRPVEHEALRVQRTYLGETNILVTRFVRDGNPVLTLTDFLLYSRVNASDPTSTSHCLVRRIQAFGPVEVQIDLQPRFDYARAHTRLERTSDGLRAVAGTEHIDFLGEAEWEIAPHPDGNGDVARARLKLETGVERWFQLRTPAPERGPHSHLSPPELLDLTARTWGRWSNLIDYDGPWRDAVVRSALVLKGLVYEPTGALIAASTTSLPETIAGVRNWDYRYAWIRDSAYVLECFLRIGHHREAETFIRWLSELSQRVGGAQQLHPLYHITGEEDLTEFELHHLVGYRGSTPVRVGNAAAQQLQLDIYGAAMQLGHLTVQYGSDLPSTRWELIRQLVETVARLWKEPDSGVWEIRAAPRHHTFSKFQCWLAVDRAMRIGRDLGLRAPYERWQSLADEITSDILANAYDAEVGAFVGVYGRREFDASILLLPCRGFLPPTDERVQPTIAAIRRELEVSDGLLRRYRYDDGLPGEEGAFLLCSFWLIELLARTGEVNEAERLFDRLIGMAGPLGLYAEEIDPETHHHLGNFPQGFTHMGLIAAASAIRDARRDGGSRDQ